MDETKTRTNNTEMMQDFILPTRNEIPASQNPKDLLPLDFVRINFFFFLLRSSYRLTCIQVC